MPVTRNELVVLTLRRIDERYNSTAGTVYATGSDVIEINPSTWAVVPTGTGTPLTTLEMLYDLLNEAQEEWFTSAGYLEGQVTPSTPWAIGLATRQVQPWAVGGAGSGIASIWGVTGISLPTSPTPTMLKRTSLADLKRNVPGYEIAANATPTHWYQEANTIRLYPAPSVAVSPTVYGLALPERLSATVSHSAMRDDEARRILPLIAAIFLVRRKFTDDNLFGRLEELLLEYADLYRQYRARLSDELVKRFYKDPAMELRQRGK